MRILCRTLFDCTYTGVTGNFKMGQLPFQDQAQQSVADYRDWERSRNQQRNWETIMQIISLRAQPTIVAYPEQKSQAWEFVFEVEVAGVYSSNGQVDDYGTLLRECDNIPMIIGLNEHSITESQLVSHGAQQNIWFESVNNA